MIAPPLRPPASAGLTRLPVFDPEYKQDPHPWYRSWHDRPPFWAELDGQAVVVTTRFADVEAIYRDHDRFSSVKPPAPDMLRYDFFNGHRDMVHTDPPDHTRLRATIGAAFSPAAVARLEKQVESLADDLGGAMAARSGEQDLMTELARPLSVRTLLGILLGMRDEDFRVFTNLASAMALVGETGPDGRKPQAYLDAWEAGRRYCLDLIEARRRAPGDDLPGNLVRAHLAGKLSDDELLVMLIGLFVGGLSSVATTIGNGFVQLLTRPEQYRLLCARPELLPNAVEEVLRYDAAGLFNYKFASGDCEFAGLEIPAGTTVYLIHAATGFDPARFADPFRFDIQRPVSRHLSFGFGIHVCIGAPIARLGLRAAFRTTIRLMPQLRLVANTQIRYGGWQQERAPLAVPVTT